jgi:hypothetical protein
MFHTILLQKWPHLPQRHKRHVGKGMVFILARETGSQHTRYRTTVRRRMFQLLYEPIFLCVWWRLERDMGIDVTDKIDGVDKESSENQHGRPEQQKIAEKYIRETDEKEPNHEEPQTSANQCRPTKALGYLGRIEKFSVKTREHGEEFLEL